VYAWVGLIRILGDYPGCLHLTSGLVDSTHILASIVVGREVVHRLCAVVQRFMGLYQSAHRRTTASAGRK
jgi:hypothetical protein